MDPKHRDRIAFMRICSGKYEKGMKMKPSTRIGKDVKIADAVTFMAGDRSNVEKALCWRHNWFTQSWKYPNW